MFDELCAKCVCMGRCYIFLRQEVTDRGLRGLHYNQRLKTAVIFRDSWYFDISIKIKTYHLRQNIKV